MKNEQTLDNKVEMAKEIGKMLPETNDKVEHYKDVLRAEANLLNGLEARQSKWYISAIKKLREKVEVVNIKNSIFNKQKIYENYLGRKKKYEGWLDEMSREVNTNWESTIEDARKLKGNLRLDGALQEYDASDRLLTMHEKVEFYLYLKQEIANRKKYGKGK